MSEQLREVHDNALVVQKLYPDIHEHAMHVHGGKDLVDIFFLAVYRYALRKTDGTARMLIGLIMSWVKVLVQNNPVIVADAQKEYDGLLAIMNS